MPRLDAQMRVHETACSAHPSRHREGQICGALSASGAGQLGLRVPDPDPRACLWRPFCLATGAYAVLLAHFGPASAFIWGMRGFADAGECGHAAIAWGSAVLCAP